MRRRSFNIKRDHAARAFGGAVLVLAMIAGAMSCARPAKDITTSDDLMKEFYDAQLTMLDALNGAFYQIGQEYYILAIEYADMGHAQLSSLTNEKAVRFHRQHLEIQERITELQEKRARLARGEKPREVVVNPTLLAPMRTPGAFAPSAPRLALQPPLTQSRPVIRSTPMPVPLPVFERRPSGLPVATPPAAISTPRPSPTPRPAPSPSDVSPPESGASEVSPPGVD